MQQNINRNNANNAVSQTTRIVPHFPPTNKEFSCTELHTPDGIYPLLHETFFETIAPQFAMGTRASITNANDDFMNHHHLESSEDESLTAVNGCHSYGGGLGGASLSMTPVIKSAALPIPNAATTTSASSSSRRTLRTTSSFNNNPNINGLQVLTSPQKIMTTTASGNNASPYLPNSPPYPTTPTSQLLPTHSQTQHYPQQQQQHQQFATGSYMMSTSHDLSHTPIAEYSISSSFNNTNNTQANGGSVGSLSSLFGRSSSMYTSNPMGVKSTPQLSTSIVRTMSTSMSSNSSTSKPKNHLSKTNSTFVLRFLINENLAKLLATKALEDDFLFFNIGSSFIWADPKSKQRVRTA